MTFIIVAVVVALAFFIFRRPRSSVLLDLPQGSLGSTTNPVKCPGPPGEMEYLLRLRGSDGQPAGYRRIGKVENGTLGHVVDVYAVVSADRKFAWKLHMDMYFMDHRETRPIQGFTLVEKTSVKVPGLDPGMQDVYRLLQSKTNKPGGATPESANE
jgi:hypothetical protein